MTVAVFLHILGAAIWAGGLIFVGLVAGAARRTVPERERVEFFRVLGGGFLVLAGVAAPPGVIPRGRRVGADQAGQDPLRRYAGRDARRNDRDPGPGRGSGHIGKR